MSRALSLEDFLTRSAARGRAAAALFVLALLASPSSARADDQVIQRGAYLFAAGDCASCHTDTKNHGAPLAGGRALATPFGTFFGPNITPDRNDGIGAWSEADFHHALRDGIGRNGEYLYPVFPFTSFTGMSDDEIADLYAYIMAQKPVAQPDKPHAVRFPFGFRPLLAVWRMMFFTPGPLAPVAGQSAEWNRGRHLVEAVAHCEECHTPRNLLGGLERDHAFAGNPDGPDRPESAQHYSRHRHWHRQMEPRRHHRGAADRLDPRRGFRQLRHGGGGRGHRAS